MSSVSKPYIRSSIITLLYLYVFIFLLWAIAMAERIVRVCFYGTKTMGERRVAKIRRSHSTNLYKMDWVQS